MKYLALFVVLGACGDNLPDRGTPRSGERLKLGWWVYADGTRQRELGWYYDAALDARCTPGVWSDGNRYCAPHYDDAVYVNDTCTRALGRGLIGQEPARFVATAFYMNGEPRPSRLFARGAPTSAPISVWQKHLSGCIGPMEPGDSFAYFDVEREIADLPRLHRSEPFGGSTLAIVHETSDDGLRVPAALYDTTLAVECTPADRAHVERVECVPNDAALLSYFREVGCLEPELAVTDGSTPSTAMLYSDLTRCWAYFAVGMEETMPPLYEQIGGTCRPASPPGGADFYAMGGPQHTQGLQRERASTPGRLAAIDLVHDELRVADPRLYDRELGAECVRDDDMRCVPDTEAVIDPFFADSGCTVPLDLALVPAGECDAPTKFARGITGFHPLVAPYGKTIYWLSTGDTCGIYAPPAPFTAWTVGPAIAIDLFVRAQLTIDP
jgi:hypothetical protein